MFVRNITIEWVLFVETIFDIHYFTKGQDIPVTIYCDVLYTKMIPCRQM